MSDEKLRKLHDLLCDELTDRLLNGEETEDGKVPVKANTLNVIRQFLKDNNIDAIPVENSRLNNLINELPPEFRLKN